VSLPTIKDIPITEYLRILADDSLFPSAGAAAGTTAAQSAALFAMVCRVNLRKLQDKAGTPDEEMISFWEQTLEQAEELAASCLKLAQEDGTAYREVVDKDPRGPAHAMEVPLEIARLSLEITGLIKRALPRSYTPVRADAETSLALAQGSFQAGLVVARYNLPLLHDQAERDDYVNTLETMKNTAH
jgi:formiminotetrahydrofolate cyclodeaminase